MARYPFDRQRVVIPIDETRYGADRLLFEPDVVVTSVPFHLRTAPIEVPAAA